MQTCNQHSFKINTAESAQPRNCSIVTRPFSLWQGGVWAQDYWSSSIDQSICHGCDIIRVTPMYVRPGPMAHWY